MLEQEKRNFDFDMFNEMLSIFELRMADYYRDLARGETKGAQHVIKASLESEIAMVEHLRKTAQYVKSGEKH